MEGNGYETRETSQQRSQDFCLKVQDRRQSFVLCPYTIHKVHHKNVTIGKFLSTKITAIVFCAW